MMGHLMESLPKGSVVAIESGLTLDGSVLPDFDRWDVRRYGSTQLAIRVVDVERTNENSGEEHLVADDDAVNGGDVDE
jgi:16S rRNA (guanine966-N2)-methyltransferase